MSASPFAHAPVPQPLTAAIRGGKRPFSSIRLRYATVATLLAALTFGLGGGLALTLYRNSLVGNVEQSVRTAAQQIGASVQLARAPDPIPMPVGPEIPRVEVLDSQGHIVTGDPASVASPPLLGLVRSVRGGVVTIVDPRGLPEHRAAVLVRHVATRWGDFTIVVSQSLDAADAKAAHALRLSGLLALLSLAIVGLVAWLTTGHTLRRVEKIRSEVAGITASGDLRREVPVSATDELGCLGQTLNQLLAAVANSDERQRRFVADAAHEIRTPLAGMTTSVDVAVRHPDTVDPEWLSDLAEGHRRLTLLVNDLLELAALDGHAPRSLMLVDLAGVVADAVRRPVPAGVRIETQLVEPIYVEGVETQLMRIVVNLVDNAVRHASARVDVRLSSEGGQVRLEVADDGPGVPSEDRDLIWERFGRSGGDRSRLAGGTGLGLALVKELAETHGGSVGVGVDGHLGGGLFVVELPLPDGSFDSARGRSDFRELTRGAVR